MVLNFVNIKYLENQASANISGYSTVGDMRLLSNIY